ncbi:ABC transporter ATP-binding protein [Geitlerinema sp. PCC 9228]|jgi:cobalt/nickel transport system ATP-binding protein|uniref:energy-coupling factor ABC transporter ATP-binding protein n=1 Tax=Geitlerinema sp. PCC 9228 TaxID=111611 RepID=UPI001FCDEB95|nr:ABC transporter ATP-binding protein [Geitlerinema sp. PCC 9228]
MVSSEMTDWFLQFQNVTYTYPGQTQPTIDNLTLSIPQGKKSALIGQNGSGKSTLLFLADGLYKPQQGEIAMPQMRLRYNRRSLNRWRKSIGLAFQDPNEQLVAGTVTEDISYGLYNLGLPEKDIKQRLRQIIADFSLEEIWESPLHHLSMGQKRRVALAGAIALHPNLLLLDEPTAYLDGLQTHHLLQELDRIWQNGTTLLMATHDLDLAYAWADWFFIVHQGKLILQGKAEDVFSQRDLLREVQLGVPLLWEVWESLGKPTPMPRNVEQLQQHLHKT